MIPFFKCKPKLIKFAPEELARLRIVEQMAGQLVKGLNDAKVDYDLVKRLEKIINANHSP